MKGYKVFNSDWICHERQYSCPGVFEHKGKLKLGNNGIHFYKTPADCFKYYDFDSENKVAEIEVIGNDVLGNKEDGLYCARKIEIIRELSWYEVLDLVNTGKNNTGFENHGDYNTGDWNTGNWNTGNWNNGVGNTGNNNPGDWNTGNYNIGNWNTGECNNGSFNTGNNSTGDWNVGNYNSGNYNSGNHNDGDYNTGNYNHGSYNAGMNNTGVFNSGDYNVGNYNTGDFNKSDRNFGCFNTVNDKMRFFNKESDMTYEEWESSEARRIIGGFFQFKSKKPLNVSEQNWWNNLSKEKQEIVLSLPNFNADIFKEITNIDVATGKKMS